MFKDVQSTFCARVQKFQTFFFVDMNMFEVVSSEIQFFLVIKVIKKIGSCISPEKKCG